MTTNLHQAPAAEPAAQEMTRMPAEPELLRVFIGPRAEPYMQALHSTQFQFSWVAFLFGGYWLLYRKMPGYFFVLLVSGALLSLMGAIIGLPASGFLALALLLNTALGMMGLQLYARFAQHRVQDYRKDPKFSVKIFSESGGTSFSQPVLLLLVQLAAVFMLRAPFLQY